MSELVESFARVRRDRPSRPLVHLPAQRRSWTADELWRRFEQTRDVLTSAGIGAGDLLIARAADAPTALAVLAATLARGATYAPCDRSTPSPELLRLADRFGARATVVDDEAIDVALADRPHIALPGGHHLRLHDPNPAAPTRRADIALLKLTSGSTGEPKAAAVTEAQLIADSRRLMAAMRIGPADIQVAATPLSHAYGHGNLVVPVLLQGTAIVRRESFVPQKLVEDATAYGATAFPGVPFMFDHLAAHLPDEAWPPLLKNLLSAGAPLSLATVRAFHACFGVKVHSFYGTSEGGGISYDDAEEIGDQVTQGRPLPGVTVTLRGEPTTELDGTAEAVPYVRGGTPKGAPSEREGVPFERGVATGRVHVASDGVGCGYLGETDPDFGEDGFLTGDIGRFDAEGRLSLLGRVSSFVNVAGRKVQPEEVEQVLRTIPGIADARIVGAADPRRGEQLVACLVATRPGLTVLDVRRLCAEQLAPHKIPHVWIFVDAIPLTERGKTDRRQLHSMVVEHLARG